MDTSLSGSITLSDPFETGSNTTSYIQEDTYELIRQVERFWTQTGVDQPSYDQATLSVNDENVISLWDKTLEVIDVHYQLPIPFKQESPDLPDNKSMVSKRLTLLGKRFSNNNELHERYNAEVSILLHKCYAEAVPPDKLERSGGKVW